MVNFFGLAFHSSDTQAGGHYQTHYLPLLRKYSVGVNQGLFNCEFFKGPVLWNCDILGEMTSNKVNIEKHSVLIIRYRHQGALTSDLLL